MEIQKIIEKAYKFKSHRNSETVTMATQSL